MATLASLIERVRLIALSLANSAKKGDVRGVAKWAHQLADAAAALATAADPTAPKFVVNPAAPTVEVPDSYFAAARPDDVLMIGGSPGNPDGVTLTFAQAIDWWRVVFAHGLNIGKVRPSLTPGSKVLTPEGLAAARALGVTSIDFAPADFNPLGLDVVP